MSSSSKAGRPEDVGKLNLPTNDPDGVSDDEADACRYLLIQAMAQGFTSTVSKFRL